MKLIEAPLDVATMDYEFSNKITENFAENEEKRSQPSNVPCNSFEEMLEQLGNNAEILCKSQQRDETDVSVQEKIQILSDIFNKSKSNFLSRFGKFLTFQQIKLFENVEEDVKDGYEIKFHLKNISQGHSSIKKHKHLRNKRYAALKRLVEKDSYFSEVEMMKRNPLLYEQLVGQYLSNKEKRIRDRQSNTDVNSFVHVLLNGIDNEQMQNKKKLQEKAENVKMDEDSSSDESEEDDGGPSTSTGKIDQKSQRFLWGEFQTEDNQEIVPKRTTKHINLSVTAQERQILKEEFISTMYESFLDGNDDDFDYSTVDDNDEYDNLEIVDNDEEEKYFDAEEPEDMNMIDGNENKREESSEDELDIYMNALNQHPSVCQLSEDIKRL
ncbi:hypothetical protein RN001_003139 [Aquatica leii]|uniref:CCD97-like C-terminal domain-containing protein n=1 Tax=Aquatica leii TaxID=1421715 RepID=A0AAN7PI60_9COLE|nr:hypothetical protein RN001_003139 [Aquatica leii]